MNSEKIRSLFEKVTFSDTINVELLRKDLLSNDGYIYYLLDNKKVVYVGQTSSHPLHRVLSHLQDKKFNEFKYFAFDCDYLDEVEALAIIKHNPKYNKTLPTCKSTFVMTLSSAQSYMRNKMPVSYKKFQKKIKYFFGSDWEFNLKYCGIDCFSIGRARYVNRTLFYRNYGNISRVVRKIHTRQCELVEAKKQKENA